MPILIASGLLVGFGFWSVYRRRPVKAGEACPTRRPLSVRVVLWISAGVWSVALALNLLRLLPSLGGG